jgi:uncharacterized membrane protein (Fun14 family)
MEINDAILTTVGSFAGSGFAGFLAGYALRKVIKWAEIIVGIFLVGLIALSARGWLIVQWNKINDSVMSLANATGPVSGVQDVAHNIMNAIGIPASSGLAAGFLFGFLKG